MKTGSMTPMIARGCLALLLLSGAAVSSAQEPAATPVVTTKSGPILPPPAGQGQIIFWRPGTIVGAAIGCTVRENGAQVGRLGSGKYFVHIAEPGKHVYTAASEVTDEQAIEVKADETLYVRCTIGAGVMAGRPNLTPSDAATFAERAMKMKQWVPKDD